MPTLCQALQQVYGLLTYVDLTVPFLNTNQASPTSDGCGNLAAGFMQLPRDSILVLSELQLTEGILSEQGWCCPFAIPIGHLL